MSDATTSERRVEGSEAFASAAAEICASARFNIDILSHELAPELWAAGDVVDAIRQTIVERPRAQVRILINDPRRVAIAGSRLIDLSQVLTTAITVRGMNRMHQDFRMEVLLGDDSLSLVRDPADRLDALCCHDNRVEVKTRRERFDVWWDAAAEVPGLRRLHL